MNQSDIDKSTRNRTPVGVIDGFRSRNSTQVESDSKDSKTAVSYSVHTVAQMNIRDVPNEVFTRYLVTLLKKSTRLKVRYQTKQLFIRKLKKFGFSEEADKLSRCCANFTALVCENGHSFRPIVDFRCHLPFCPDCWELKSHRELARNLPKVLTALKADSTLIPAFLTLTLRSDKKRALRGGIRKIKGDFKAFRRRQVWDLCAGGLGRIENTYSRKYGWHPHLHCFVFLKDYIPQKDLAENWDSVTGDSMIVDIRRVHDLASGLVETIKYPFKPADLRHLGREQIQEMLDLSGERLGLSFGVLFGIETASDIEPESEYAEFIEGTKDLEIGDSCPICQTKLDLVDFSANSYAEFLRCAPLQQINSPLIC